MVGARCICVMWMVVRSCLVVCVICGFIGCATIKQKVGGVRLGFVERCMDKVRDYVFYWLFVPGYLVWFIIFVRDKSCLRGEFCEFW